MLYACQANTRTYQAGNILSPRTMCVCACLPMCAHSYILDTMQVKSLSICVQREFHTDLQTIYILQFCNCTSSTIFSMSRCNLNKMDKYVTDLIILDSELSRLASSSEGLDVSVTFHLGTLVGPLQDHSSPLTDLCGGGQRTVCGSWFSQHVTSEVGIWVLRLAQQVLHLLCHLTST